MPVLNVDVAIIGAGSAGMSAYRAAKTAGQRVVIIEGGPYGTTCARVGCMPSKLLIAAAEAAHAVHAAPGFGVLTAPPQIDGPAVLARVRSERDRFVGFVLESVESFPPEDRLRGYARFLDPHTLQIEAATEAVVHAGNEASADARTDSGTESVIESGGIKPGVTPLQVRATSIVIATGSSANRLPELAGAGDLVQICDDVFEWPDLPKRVAVIGTGVIALELGQALVRLGVQVAIFGRSTSLAHLSDPKVLASARATLGAELDLRPHTRILGSAREGTQAVLHTRAQDGSEQHETFDFILAASGRTPNLARLAIASSGLQLDARGIPVFDSHTMQCVDAASGQGSHIFIAGDVDDETPLLHEAADQGKIAGHNAGRLAVNLAANPGNPASAVEPGLRRAKMAVAFCDPQIASVGPGFATLQTSMPGCFVCGEVSFHNQGRSRVMLQNRGLLRVYARCSDGRFLGAEMIAPRAEHMAHLLAWALQAEMSVDTMLDMPFYHPVIEEGLRTALRDLQQQLKHGCVDCEDCRPGC